MILQKNDNIEAVIESLGYRGEGVARVDRVPVFVGGALPGERVRAHVILVKKDYAVAKLTEVLSPSPARTSAGAAAAICSILNTARSSPTSAGRWRTR